MSVTKSILIAAGLFFGLATLADAAPRMKDTGAASGYSYDIPGKSHQDRFAISY
jgi:hypothetical protein